jgi:Zn-dependent protease with chaperone function
MSAVLPVADDRTCPQCGSDTPRDEGFRRWCDRCDWNVTAPLVAEDEDAVTRIYRQLGEKRGRKALEQLIATPTADLRPRLSAASAAAFAIAGFIHLLSLAVFAAGLYGLAGYPDPASMILGLFCIGMAWLLLPRPMRVPKKTVDLKAFPALKSLIDDITGKLGGAPVRHIVIDEDFNAAYAVAGWRREPMLHLGLPLWIALGPQERVALIAHEIAHGVNGDSSRGFLLGSALGALYEWIGLLRPYHRAVTLSEVLARYILSVLSLPLILLQRLLLHLLWQEQQRAEYFADYLAARIASTPAAVGLLRRFALDEHLDDILLRHAYSTTQSGDYILGLFRQRIDGLPSREWERLRRKGEAEGARLDRTHPPTAFRIAFLEAHRFAEPQCVADTAIMTAIDADFRALTEKLGSRLIAQFAHD